MLHRSSGLGSFFLCRMDLTMKAHVLLVEDESRLRTALARRLCEEGCIVDSIANANAAFEKITTQPFDILILVCRVATSLTFAATFGLAA